MCQSHKLQIIIIDSLAGLVRFEYDNKSSSQMKDRTAFLFSISRQLKWLSDTFNVAIVVVNQVTAGSTIDQGSSMGVAEQSSPALGLAWAHCVNSRIFLERSATVREVSIEDDQSNEDHYNNNQNDENQVNAVAHKRQLDESLDGERYVRKRIARGRVMRLLISPYLPSSSIRYDITVNGVVGLDELG